MKDARPIPHKVRIHSTKAEKVFEGVLFDVYQWQQKMFDDTYRTFETITRHDTVVILAVHDGYVILVRERQPHWDVEVLAAPGGRVEDDEDLLDAAKRECKEETGYEFKNWHLADASFPAPGVEWGRYIYIAKDVDKISEKRLDGGEINTLVKIPITEFIKLIRNDELHYPLPFIDKLLLKYGDERVIDLFEHPEKYPWRE